MCQACNTHALSRKLLGRVSPEVAATSGSTLDFRVLSGSEYPAFRHDEKLFGRRYCQLCIICCPDERIEQAWRRVSDVAYDKRKKESRCTCDRTGKWRYDESIRVCLGCIVCMRDARRSGLLSDGKGHFRGSCARVGCGSRLRVWGRPWRRSFHIVCILCNIPRKAEIPFLV